MKALIFDFDWVIHDTFDFHVKNIWEHFKIDFKGEKLKDMQNWNIFKAELPDAIIKMWWEWYHKHISDDYINLEIKDNIIQTLIKLKEEYLLYIISSWSEKVINWVLNKNNLNYIFQDKLCYEFHESKVYKFNYIFDKYKLTKNDCLFITDTLWDIIEANEVWLKTIAVDFGYHERERLEKWNPYKIISDFSELLNIN